MGGKLKLRVGALFYKNHNQFPKKFSDKVIQFFTLGGQVLYTAPFLCVTMVTGEQPTKNRLKMNEL